MRPHPMSKLSSVSIASVFVLLGCSSSETASSADPTQDGATIEDTTADSTTASEAATDAGSEDVATSVDVGPDTGLVAARPYQTHIPPGYEMSKPTPLVILLHGYSASGALQESYFKLSDVADTKTFLLAYPDGTLDASGNRFWNATDACCNFAGAKIDDVAYVDAIIEDMSKKYNVDPKRVYLVGHSNGGFMSHRTACDLSPRIAAIVSLAGAVWKDASKCKPTSPVSILEVHGNADMTISYDGGATSAGVPPYPSAKQTVATWAALEGCSATLTDTGKTLDLESTLPGNETKVEHHDGCKSGAVELWTIQGGGHIPSLTAQWGSLIYGFLESHPKP